MMRNSSLENARSDVGSSVHPVSSPAVSSAPLRAFLPRASRRGPLAASVALLLLALASGAQAQEKAGQSVAVDRFEFSYGLAHPSLPAVDQVSQSTVRLQRGEGGWHASAASEPQSLSQLPAGGVYDAEALREIAQGIVRWFNDRGIYGVWVMFPDIETTGASITDRRSAGDHSVRLVIWASQVAEVRTLARGGRFKQPNTVNNPKHRQIRDGSPLHPASRPGEQGSLFSRNDLEEYLRELSLHPGRRVEASIASAGEPGKIILDYLVNETKAWQFFGQIANTGTESTGKWRGRVGFQHNQLTNHDDILNLDVISTTNGDTYGTFASYRIPVIRPAKLLARVYGSYGDFLSNDATLQSLHFIGKNYLTGAELSHRLALPRSWSLFSVLGTEYVHYEIESQVSQTTLAKGHSNFMVPHLSGTLSNEGDRGSISATLRLETTVGDFANLSQTDGIPILGRIGADADWTALRWNIDGNLLLDRLFVKRAVATQFPVHELRLSARGKMLLRGERLIPQVQDPMGGAFTVRGYPESVLTADEFALGSLEYLFHLPRSLKEGDAGTLFGQPFRWRATSSRQSPDWDLIFRVFYDHGYRKVAPAFGGSGSGTGPLIDRTLQMSGAGVGAELIVRHNMSLRCDIGTALKELRDPVRPTAQQVVVESGNVQAYLVATFVW
jgi:hemolysin activation/secretion protein